MVSVLNPRPLHRARHLRAQLPALRICSLHHTILLPLLMATLTHAANPKIDQPDSPEILADQQVTFRFFEPNAKEVKLRGIQNQPTPMTKDDKGIWSVTVGPVVPGIYGYSFVVDGEAVIDPSNPDVKPERDPNESELEILSTKPILTQWRDVPHGTVHLNDYYSPILKRVRHLRVYTPPGYEKNPDKRWPVLYLLHGTGDTEATWVEFGHAHYISDNLIAERKCRPAIIVMPDGHADLHDEEGDATRNLQQTEQDLTKVVIPFVDQLYHTIPDADHRAICGLSMGGIQSLFIGLRNQSSFAWVGGMSAYVDDVESTCATALNNPKRTNRNLRLLWNQIGRDDFLLPQQQTFEKTLKKHGIHGTFRVTNGDHEWSVWRRYLSDFLPLLFK